LKTKQKLFEKKNVARDEKKKKTDFTVTAALKIIKKNNHLPQLGQII